MKSCFAVVILAASLSLATKVSALDCSKMAAPIEKAICNQADLAKLDGDLNKLYAELQPQLTPEAQRKLLSQQRAWLTKRNTVCVDGNASCLGSEYRKRLDQLQALSAAAAVASGKLNNITPVVVKGTWKATAIQQPERKQPSGEVNVGQSIQFADLPSIGSMVTADAGKVCFSPASCVTTAWTRVTVATVDSIDNDLGLRPTDQVLVGRYVSDHSPHLVLVPRDSNVVWAVFDLCASNQMHCHSAVEVWTPAAAESSSGSR